MSISMDKRSVIGRITGLFTKITHPCATTLTCAWKVIRIEHRNTLVYRLDKIKKLTGLDLREFDHAIIFKIALMVKKYLAADPVKF